MRRREEIPGTVRPRRPKYRALIEVSGRRLGQSPIFSQLLSRRIGWMVLAVLAAGCSQRQARVVTPPAPHRLPGMEIQVRNAVEAGDGDFEVAALQRALVADPANLELRRKLAARYEESGHPELAIDHLRLAGTHHPDNASLRVDLVRALHDMKLPQEALRETEIFTASHAEAPAEIWSWQAILLDETGRLAEGEKSHRRAVETAPREGYLHNNLGQNLLAQGRRPEAVAEFRRALELEPENETARNNLGIAVADEARAGEASDALAQWQSVSDPASAHNNLAAVFIQRREYGKARLEINIALNYNNSHAAALRNLELVSRLDGKPAQIERIIVPSPPDFWDRVGGWFKKAFGSTPASRPAPAQTERAAEPAPSPVSNP